ncbi:MAG TPA: Ppx/GppA phosphatase family protein [Methanoregulaceae archaeon]|nr:Ppx/GppA phosphatase family protein [Methanoregulaceae archaeon]HPD75704.1 Ppx/GppA phosphatase family protein [Methanoregulaceae archaeon]HRY74712.1 Ppx/GppA phosphatase family protein [Methanoregulaceae archaeon]
MSPDTLPVQCRVVSFIDIGTNSVRLLVVRFNPNHSFTVLSRQKQQVRLGEGEFEEEEILPAAMDRAVMVCRQFTDLARTFSCEEFVAVATAALRDAVNKNDLLNRLRHEARLDVRVISGREEARLIYLGIASGMHLSDKNAVFIDIGGGSTEIAIGGARQYDYLGSFNLGAIRLTNQYFSATHTGPVSPEHYRKIQQHVRNALVTDLPKLRKLRRDLAFGSSGTITNLAEMAARMQPRTDGCRKEELSYRDLRKIIDTLCPLSLEERKRVPGINPERADIIVAGAAILDTVMKELGISCIRISSRGLQDGLLADYLSRMDEFPLFGELSVRQRSVLQLGRSCGINEAHARTVSTLALELFDSAKRIGLHQYSERERELLEYATFLHDVGSFISYTNHHAHSFYIISNAELLGFDHKEIATIANIARFHRKKAPRRKTVEMPELDAKEQDLVRILSTFLRLAESLDRSHAALVHHVRFTRADKTGIHMNIIARGDCQLELWGVEGERKAFARIFKKDLVFDLQKEALEPIL